jgi:hypothetical protein
MPGSACPICEAPNATEFLRRGAVPVHQNLLFDTAEAARAIARGTLAMHVCGACGFAFNAAFDPTLLDYGTAYENSQDCSAAFNSYLDGLVQQLVERHGVRNGRVVEVGCGKGAFLTKLLTHPANRSSAVGFDPTYLGPDEVLGGRLRFKRVFYGPETAVPADVVVCRHVIEHVPDPLGLLRTVRAEAGQWGKTKVFFETPCVDWILRHRVPWDFFYEHCSLFTRHSLGLALTRAGFRVTDVRHVFGGQYLWAEAETGVGQWPAADGDTPRMAREFAAVERSRLTYWLTLLNSGRTLVWGAGAKGVTFCNLADPRAERVLAVVDVNPAKQGKYLAGTGHPILSPEAALGLRPDAVLVLNPNYVAEVADVVSRLGSSAAVIDLMHQEGTRAAHH